MTNDSTPTVLYYARLVYRYKRRNGKWGTDELLSTPQMTRADAEYLPQMWRRVHRIRLREIVRIEVFEALVSTIN